MYEGQQTNRLEKTARKHGVWENVAGDGGGGITRIFDCVQWTRDNRPFTRD